MRRRRCRSRRAARRRACVSAMTISSSAALPARSPMPLMVHSTCRAPPSTPASEFATARPRSLWQWTEKTALSESGTRSRTVRNMLVVFVRRRVADRVGQVDRRRAGPDRRLDAAAEIVDRRARRVHGATIRRPRRGCGPARTVAVMISSTSSSVLRIWCARWIGEVETKVWMRARLAWRTASPARAMSAGDGAGEAGDTGILDRAARSRDTASKSPFEAIGKPASMMSTPMASRSSATWSFSSRVMVAPGHCSPSRKVVSKIRTRSLAEPAWRNGHRGILLGRALSSRRSGSGFGLETPESPGTNAQPTLRGD